MRIVIVINSLFGGGAERVVSTLSKEWANSHDVTVALFDGARIDYQYGGTVEDLRLPVAGNPVRKIRTAVWRSARLAKLFRAHRPDGIVAFMESANFPCIVAAALTGYLSRLRVSVRINPHMLAPAHRLLIPWIYRLPARVVALSHGVRDGLVGLGVPREKVVVIHNPVIIGGNRDAQATSKFPSRFILGVGRLVRQKGFDLLVNAFGEIGERNIDLVILGEGEERSAISSLAHRLGVADRVHMPGRVTDVAAWYRAAQCFVLSSRYEGWGNVVVEAMANECPVVSFDCPFGPSEIVEDGKNGVLVPEGDVKGLSVAIERVLSDRSMQTRLKVEGKRRAAAFRVERVARLWWTGSD